jgi:peptide/nickel transport system permease protein
MDEAVLDPRLSLQSQKAIQEQNGLGNPLVFYGRFFGRLLRGDLGQSTIFTQSVGPLVKERAPTTIWAVLGGLAIGWTGAIVLAIAAALSRRAPATLVGLSVSSMLLSIPSAVLAIVCVLLRLSPAVAIGAVVLPRVFPHAYEQLRSSIRSTYVLMARARGIAGMRLFLFHIVPPTILPMAALASVSIPLALGASIPIEALADSPGLGQLAWRAALGRDLQVLVIVTLLLTGVTVFVNVLADLTLIVFGERMR